MIQRWLFDAGRKEETLDDAPDDSSRKRKLSEMQSWSKIVSQFQRATDQLSSSSSSRSTSGRSNGSLSGNSDASDGTSLSERSTSSSLRPISWTPGSDLVHGRPDNNVVHFGVAKGYNPDPPPPQPQSRHKLFSGPMDTSIDLTVQQTWDDPIPGASSFYYDTDPDEVAPVTKQLSASISANLKRKKHESTSSTSNTTTSSEGHSTSVPSLASSQSTSAYLSPVSSILISRFRVIFLPGISRDLIFERLIEFGYNFTALCASINERPAHSGNGSGSSAAQANRSSLDTQGSKSSRIAKSSGGHSSRKSGLSLDSGRTEAPRKRVRKTTASKRFGCPFAKHDPHRYQAVYSACTLPKGIEWKHVVEHVERKHGKVDCPWCGHKWPPGASWIDELENHTRNNPCTTEALVATKSEPMTRAQQLALQEYKNEPRVGPERRRWLNLFEALFPDEYPIPSPYYDFYKATHLIEEPSTPMQHTRDPPMANFFQPVAAVPAPMILASTGLEDVEPSFDDLDFDPFMLRSGVGPDSTNPSLHAENAWQNYTVVQGQFGMDLAADNGSSDRTVVKASGEQGALQVLEEYLGQPSMSMPLPDYQV